MSLKLFHLFFIGVSVVLAAFCVAWSTGMYRAAHDATYLAASIASALAAVGLIAYGAAFQRKMRRL
jgi:hypothetical protein